MTQRLAAAVGTRRAKELSFTARTFSGQEAAQYGLANASMPLVALKSFVEKTAQMIAENSDQAVSAIKHLYHFGSRHNLDEGLKYEAEYELKITDKSNTLKDFKKNLGTRG